VVAQVPLDRLLIETEAPYLTPVPHRGRPNEPRFVTHVAACIAAVRNQDRDEVVAASGKNFFRLFRAAEKAAGADAAANAVRSHDSAG
jgi:TatD DNase family protein